MAGFYVNLIQFEAFKDCKFFIPKKLDWLLKPHLGVQWGDFKSTLNRIIEFHQEKSSPLIWMKEANGSLKKLFVVWWD